MFDAAIGGEWGDNDVADIAGSFGVSRARALAQGEFAGIAAVVPIDLRCMIIVLVSEDFEQLALPSSDGGLRQMPTLHFPAAVYGRRTASWRFPFGDGPPIDGHLKRRCARVAPGRFLDRGECHGRWNCSQTLSRRSLTGRRSVKVDMTGVRELDTLGAWLLEKMARRATAAGHQADMVGVADNYVGLIEEVRQVNRRNLAPASARKSCRDQGERYRPFRRQCDGRCDCVPADARLAFRGPIRRAAQAAIAPADLGGPSARPRRLAGDADHPADHLPDRRHHRAAGHSSISASSAPTTMSSTWSASWCCARSAC